MSNTIYIGDVGTEIILDTGIDINAATVHSIEVKKPDGTTTEWLAEIFENTKLKYITQVDDINIAGDWIFMANIELPSWSGHGNPVAVTVSDLWK